MTKGERDSGGDGEKRLTVPDYVHRLVGLVQEHRRLPDALRSGASALINHAATRIVESTDPERFEAGQTLSKLAKKFPAIMPTVHNYLKAAEKRRQEKKSN